MRQLETPSPFPRWIPAAALAVATVVFILWPQKDPGNRLEEIQAAVNRGELQQAKRILEEHCRATGNDAESLLLMSQICERLAQPDEAIKWLELLETQNTEESSCESRLRLASMCIDQGYAQRAEHHLTKALERDTECWAARRLLMRLCLLLLDQPGVRQQALLLDESGVATVEDVLMYYSAGEIRWDDVTYIDWLEKCYRKEPDNLKVVAALVRELPRHDLSSRALRLMELHSKSAQACWQLALAWARGLAADGRLEEALTVIDTTESTGNQSVQVWLLRGRIYRRLQNDEAALLCLRNASRLDPTDPAVSRELGKKRQNLSNMRSGLSISRHFQN